MNKGVINRTITRINKPSIFGGVRRPQNGVLEYPGQTNASGGNSVTVENNIRYHKFTASGSLTIVSGNKIEALVVSGGGSGGSASWSGTASGGGGGGARVYELNVIPGEIISVVVGGGAGSPGYLSDGIPGGTSSISGSFGLLSIVGGAGGDASWNSSNAVKTGNDQGACGAGSLRRDAGGASMGGGGGMGGPGYDGNNTTSGGNTNTVRFGFRGGAFTTGVDIGGNGGPGELIWGSYYCGGGGGAPWASATPSSGGVGGGGASGYYSSRSGTSGTVNTGGGGGGASMGNYSGGQSTTYGGNGGSGIVIFRYAI